MQNRKTSNEAMEQMATVAYKYQDYKSRYFIDKIKNDNDFLLQTISKNYGVETLKSFHSMARRFLFSGKTDRRLPKVFFNKLEQLKANHYAKLTPSTEQKGRTYAAKIQKQNKTIKTTICGKFPSAKEHLKVSNETLDKIKQQYEQQRQQKSKQYVGLLYNDLLKVFKNEDEMNGYFMACKDMQNEVNLQIVDIIVTPRI